jgi:hypothetical protein
MTEAHGMSVLEALSRGAAVSHDGLVAAGRMTSRAVMASRGTTVLYSNGPWLGVWELDRLSDRDAASLGLRFAKELAELRAALGRDGLDEPSAADTDHLAGGAGGAPGGTRTPSLLIRSQTLCPN